MQGKIKLSLLHVKSPQKVIDMPFPRKMQDNYVKRAEKMGRKKHYPKCDAAGKKRFSQCMDSTPKGRFATSKYRICTIKSNCSPFRKHPIKQKP
jgi:hypothetical protein